MGGVKLRKPERDTNVSYIHTQSNAFDWPLWRIEDIEKKIWLEIFLSVLFAFDAECLTTLEAYLGRT